MKKIVMTCMVAVLLLSAGTTPTAIQSHSSPGSGDGIRDNPPAAAGSGDGSTLYVGGTGPGNYTSIQTAVDAASDGDTVFVYDDSSPYYESVDIDRSIALIGESRDTTIIDGNGSWAAVNITVDNVTLRQFTIQNGKFSGIHLYSNRNHISDNSIINNGWDGIYLDYSSRNHVVRNRIVSTDGWAIDIHYSDDNTIANNTIDFNRRGITLIDAYNNNISNNSISNQTLEGIVLWTGHRNHIYNNVFSNNDMGLYLSAPLNTVSGNSFYGCGLTISDSPNTVVKNTVNGKPLVYVAGQFNTAIREEAGQIIVADCRDITIQNQHLSNTTVGVQLFNCHGCSISDSVFSQNGDGVFLYLSAKNRIEDCMFSGNEYAIYVGGSDKSKIVNNSFSNNTHGIWIGGEQNVICDNRFSNHNSSIRGGTDRSTIQNNVIQNNTKYGIFLGSSSYNRIDGNMVKNSQYGMYLTGKYSGSNRNDIIGNELEKNEYGVYLKWGEHNFIHNNNFVDNNIQAFDRCSDTWICHNWWDNGMDGNYWSDFDEPSEGAYDNDSDGIIDKAYHISGGKMTDRYPLAHPWGKNLKIEIAGGFGVKIVIKNVGNESLSNVNWSIELKGLILFGKTREGEIPSIKPNQTYELDIPIFGLGRGTIKVVAEDSFKTNNMVVVGPLVFIDHPPKMFSNLWRQRK